MDAIPIGQAVLRKVVERVGFRAAASALEAQPSALADYLDGTLLIPDDVFLRAIDLVPDDLSMILSRSSQPDNHSPG